MVKNNLNIINLENNYNNILYNVLDENDDFQDNFVFEDDSTDTDMWDTSSIIENYVEFIQNYPIKIKSTSYVYFSIFLFFEKFFNTSIFVFNRSIYNTFNYRIVSSINLCYIYILRLYKRISKNFNLYSFLYCLAASMYYKDITLLKNFFIEKIKKLSFRKHKRLLSMLRYAFRLIGSMMIKNKSILGFKMFLSGKIGMAGSTKKKK